MYSFVLSHLGSNSCFLGCFFLYCLLINCERFCSSQQYQPSVFATIETGLTCRALIIYWMKIVMSLALNSRSVRCTCFQLCRHFGLNRINRCEGFSCTKTRLYTQRLTYLRMQGFMLSLSLSLKKHTHTHTVIRIRAMSNLSITLTGPRRPSPGGRGLEFLYQSILAVLYKKE